MHSLSDVDITEIDPSFYGGSSVPEVTEVPVIVSWHSGLSANQECSSPKEALDFADKLRKREVLTGLSFYLHGPKNGVVTDLIPISEIDLRNMV